MLECSFTKAYKSSIDFSFDILQQKGMIFFISLIVCSDNAVPSSFNALSPAFILFISKIVRDHWDNQTRGHRGP